MIKNRKCSQIAFLQQNFNIENTIKICWEFYKKKYSLINKSIYDLDTLQWVNWQLVFFFTHRFIREQHPCYLLQPTSCQNGLVQAVSGQGWECLVWVAVSWVSLSVVWPGLDTERREGEREWALEQGEDLDRGRGHTIQHKVSVKVTSGLSVFIQPI